MDRFRTILSKTLVFSRLNLSTINRYSQIPRSFSKQQKDLISSRANANYSFSRCVVQLSSHRRLFASEVKTEQQELSQVDFEKYCADTLESLTDYFDELVEKFKEFEAADVVFKDGVLTVSLGKEYGIYVINKQTPNKQIWLSSPRSGPKRFDFVASHNGNEQGYWIYKHTGVVLHELLDKEMGEIVSAQTGFQQLPFGTRH